MSNTSQKTTPMMAQWQACKQAAGEALLLFRMGDFYEAFHDDAEALARSLELTLTQRQGIPMAGVPWHSSEGYIERLVNLGFKVAVAEQMEDPKGAKQLVSREVVRIVTAGSLTTHVADKDNNYFVGLAYQSGRFGLAVLDLTTSEFRMTELEGEQTVLDELCRLRPSEILVSEGLCEQKSALFADVKQLTGAVLSTKPNWHFDAKQGLIGLSNHYGVHTLDGFGIGDMPLAINAAGTLLGHLRDDLHHDVSYVDFPKAYSNVDAMQIDHTTQRQLELTEPFNGENNRKTLLRVLDRTQTAVGGRMLRQWIKRPLLNVAFIVERQDFVEAFVQQPLILAEAGHSLQQMRDLERLCTRICSSNASPRDLLALALSLKQLPSLKATLYRCPVLASLAEQIDSLEACSDLLLRAISDQPPLRVSEGGAIRECFHAELDELRAVTLDHKNWIARHQENLRKSLDIKTLRIGYNRVFGYYIEVSRGQADRIPATYQRRQTLAGSERFISPELKAYEEKVLTAEERMLAIEADLFATVRKEAASESARILRTAHAVGLIDCLQSLAVVARERQFVRPRVDAGHQLQIRAGRHPVIEQGPHEFVPNDIRLDAQGRRMLLITGPNMAGKSTYIRQVALLVIMAQVGSFLPADEAHVGVIDRLFTRIGASDNLARGQSTFMVEMTETANILNNATPRSLVILDEIGRGTSTYDGLAIASAVAEHLLTERAPVKVLFATHYFELTELAKRLLGVINLTVAVTEHQGNVVFLHKIIPGCTDRAYGIHVAKLAGLPLRVVRRAEELLSKLQSKRQRAASPDTASPDAASLRRQEMQLTFFSS